MKGVNLGKKGRRGNRLGNTPGTHYKGGEKTTPYQREGFCGIQQIKQ